jgi:hypothetical protein
LTSQEIEGWIIGDGTPELATHLRTCRFCADEVRRAAEPFELFGRAVRGWSRQLEPSSPFVPNWWGLRVGRLALAAAALIVMVAAPVYRHRVTERTAAEIAAQDEILLRQVEAGIARPAPEAMEPLAKLMTFEVGR